MKTIAVANLKGGVGKTTLAVNLGAALSRLGRRVLLVDLDPQANLTDHLGVDFRDICGVEHYFQGEEALPDVRLCYTENLDFLPAGKELVQMESRLQKMPLGNADRYFTIRNAFNKSTLDYDYIVLDCPPSMGLLTINALSYVDYVFLPIQCHYFALKGLGKMLALIDAVKQKYNADLDVGAVIPAMYDRRNRISKFVINRLQDHFNGKLTDAKININIKLAESPRYGKTIFDYQPRSIGAQDFQQLAEEIVARFEVVR